MSFGYAMSSEDIQVSLHVKITIAPENVDKFFEYMKPAYDAVCAEKECTYFEIYHNPNVPGELKWIENWTASMDWLMGVSGGHGHVRNDKA
jgi:quinol monooxygenase YgiN